MHRFVIPALDLLYGRLQRGFSRRQKGLAILLGTLVLLNFMFRAACPPERRFFVSPLSGTLYVCAAADLVKAPLPPGAGRNARYHGPDRRAL